MLDISFLLEDPDFCTTFELIIDEGCFCKGRYIPAFKARCVKGVVRPTSGDDLDMLPEADRGKGAVTFYARKPMYVVDGLTAMRAKYKGKEYKLTHVDDFGDNGFYRAIGVLVDSDDENENI